ncbi:hypothetical protein Vretimale_1903 [Volvox reticuliferus]|uniref:Uncharacterized protein n=1 Tax=Volvox reticuliferus TaxID=1737510 RepID=A0A8J4CV98_9CHLO|nr:hypothetical protein Vretifemale_17361 [Volvox reticuliferus]GIL95992.1 hypothetical protein Vretimale_1903 [Volvox reticuliferus]
MCLCSAPVNVARNPVVNAADDGSGYPAGSCPPAGNPHQLDTNGCWVHLCEGSKPSYSRNPFLQDVMSSWPRRGMDILVSGRCSDGRAGQPADPSGYYCGMDSRTDRAANPLGTSSFSQHVGWPIGDILLPSTSTAAETFPLINKYMNIPHKALNVAAATMIQKGQVYEGPVEDNGDRGKDEVEEEDEEMDEEDDVDSLLRPGGSPCLPMEDGWALPRAAKQIASIGAAVNSDDGLTSCSFGVEESFDTADITSDSGHLLRAPPPPPLSRHRACQLGYTDSAPAHSTTAVSDIKLEFLREPTAAARWQVLGGTLSAPPGATAAYAASSAAAARKAGTAVSAFPKPGTAVGALYALPAVEKLEHAVLQPLVLDKEMSSPEREAVTSGTYVRQPAAGFGYNCGYGAAAAAATDAALPPPLAELHEMVDSSSCPPSHAAKSPFTNANANDPDVPSGIFGTPLADGLASLLEGLAAGGTSNVTRAGASGSVLHKEEFLFERMGEYEQVQKRNGDVAALHVTRGSARRFGRGLLACFTGQSHGHRLDL